MPDDLAIGLAGTPLPPERAGAAIPFGLLLPVGSGFAFTEYPVSIILGLLLVLLIGLLLYLRRIRVALEQESAALKKSENHLRILGDNLQEITIFQLTYDLSGGSFRFSFMGAGCEQVLGIRNTRIMDDAQIVLDHVYEEDIPLLQRAFRKASEHLEATPLEIRMLDAVGNHRWVLVSAIPQRVNQQLVWDGFMQDITESKETEQSLSEESRNFQNLFETIDDFLVVCDTDGRLLHTNPSLAKRLGYSRQELDGMNLSTLYPEERQSEVKRIIAQLHSATSASCDLPLQIKTGPRIPVEMNLFQGAWKNQKAIFGVARDIARHQQTESALRESQKMLQLIIDTIPMSIFWKDKDSVYLGCNKAFIEECGLITLDEVVGKTPFDLFDASTAKTIIERDQSVINTNQAQFSLSESYARTDGSMAWREISLIPLRDERGHAVGVLGVWQDVTERNRAEERLKRTLDDMERFNQLMRGRERRTLELKDEINELLLELGRSKKYRTTTEDMP